jgi:hypothetical protein
MARGPTGKKPDPKKEIPTLRLWLEEAWHGWLKPVGAILALIVAYLAYDRGMIPEGTAGLVVVGLIIGGTIVTVGFPLFEQFEKRPQKLAFGVFLGLWALGAGYPALRRAFPSKALGDPVHVAYCKSYKNPIEHKDCTDQALVGSVTLPAGGGPYEISVSGELKGQSEVESHYHLTFAGADGKSEELDGTLSRTFVHQRTSRRGSGGSMQKQERTENAHRLSSAITGPTVKVTADGLDEDALESGLQVTFHNAGPDPRLFLIATVLCLLIAVFLDYKLAAPKVKTYLATGVGLTLVFAWYYPVEATPHNLVRPAIAALVAGCGGALGGWLLSVIVKSFKPKPKRLAR